MTCASHCPPPRPPPASLLPFNNSLEVHLCFYQWFSTLAAHQTATFGNLKKRQCLDQLSEMGPMGRGVLETLHGGLSRWKLWGQAVGSVGRLSWRWPVLGLLAARHLPTLGHHRAWPAGPGGWCRLTLAVSVRQACLDGRPHLPPDAQGAGLDCPEDSGKLGPKLALRLLNTHPSPGHSLPGGPPHPPAPHRPLGARAD